MGGFFDFRPVGSQIRLAVSPHERPDDADDVAPVAGAVKITSVFRHVGDKCIYFYDYD